MSLKPRLLIVEDDESVRTQLKWGLSDSYEVVMGADRATALDLFAEHRPPVVLVDLGLPPAPAAPTEGLALLAELLALDPFVKVIVATGQSERAIALEAIGGGAYDFLSKPVDIEELERILLRACHISQIEREYALLQYQPSGETSGSLLGTSLKMELLLGSIRKVATSEAPVLLLGESGTGKEMAARAVHQGSTRSTGPFVSINCGAIPNNLLESELFGYEKGAFTGALAQRKGRVEMAAGGTLFLDEVGELPSPSQVKLLRFLQDRCIVRVGGRGEIPVDTRVLAATNSDLKGSVGEGGFREDLYYRLAVVVLKLPPLREREGDIELLAQAFLRRFASDNQRKNLKFSPGALAAMKRYHWPGNVRELENRVRRAVIMAERQQISAGDLELNGVESVPMSLRQARERCDRESLEHALRRNGGNITGAARDLQVSRPTLYDLMGKLGLRSSTEEVSR